MLAAVVVAGCAGTISPKRQDFVVVDGKLSASGDGWTCGTAPRQSGGYFYVCDMSIDVRHVVFGEHPRNTIKARYFILAADTDDVDVVGPHIGTDEHVAAILWQAEDGPRSYVLLKFPERWCVPAWMPKEFGISDAEVAHLRHAGYPLCSANE
jgi:hypothetical protein